MSLAFITVSVKERKGGVVAKSMLEVEAEDLFQTAVTEAISTYLRKADTDESPEAAVKRIKSVSCDGCDLTDVMESERATLEKLNSPHCPILKLGFVIELSPPPSEPTDESESASKKIKCAQDIMLKKVSVDLSYLETDVDMDDNIDTLRMAGLNPTVLVLQTDGGPDHSLKRVLVKLALVAMFKELGLDHLVVIRCAPNGSAMNKVERSMSVLNLPLAHVSLKRGEMPEWAEEEVKNCNSMASVRTVADKLDERVGKAIEEVANLEKKISNFPIAEAAIPVVARAAAEVKVRGVVDSQETSTEKIVRDVMAYLGIETSSFMRNSDVVAAMATADGVAVFRDRSQRLKVLESKLEKAQAKASQNFRPEWAKSVGVPIDSLSNRMSHLKTGNRPVVVTPRVPKEGVERLHDHLKKIEPAFSPSIRLKEDLKKVPKLVSFIEKHAIITSYSFDIQKCTNVACCGEIRTPVNFRELAMQRQPTPRVDPEREGYFLQRKDALAQCKGTAALTDLTDLPSDIGEKEDVDVTNKKKRDAKVAAETGLKSWDAKKVRSFLNCCHCGKRRCIFSKHDTDYDAAKPALTQKLESVAGRYTCGDLLFGDSHHFLSKKLVQRAALTCESKIEKSYYNIKGRGLKLKDICIYCGEKGGKGFLLDTEQLREKCLTGGYKCYPICVDCLGNGKTVQKWGGQECGMGARGEGEEGKDEEEVGRKQVNLT